MLSLNCTGGDKRDGERRDRGQPKWPSDQFPVVIPDFPTIDEDVIIKLASDVSKARVAAGRRHWKEVYRVKREQRQGGGGSGGDQEKWEKTIETEEAWAIKELEELEAATTNQLKKTRAEMKAIKEAVKQLVGRTAEAQSDLVRLLDDMMRHPTGSDGWARRAWYAIVWRSGGPRPRVKRRVDKALSILDAALAASGEFVAHRDARTRRLVDLAVSCNATHQRELAARRDDKAALARLAREELAASQRALSTVRQGTAKAKLMENKLIQLKEQVLTHEGAVAKHEGLWAAKGRAFCDVGEELSSRFQDLADRVTRDQRCRSALRRRLSSLQEEVGSWTAGMPAEDIRHAEEKLRDGVETYLRLLWALWRGRREGNQTDNLELCP